MAKLYLGIDAGGTATRWRLIDSSGSTCARGEAAALSGHIFNDAAREKALSVIASLAAGLPAGIELQAIAAGITGLDHSSPAAGFFRDALADSFKLNSARVKIVSDTWLSYLACFRPGEGIVISAGTGSIAVHLTEKLELFRAGGHGALIDDLGSAVWIALEAVRRISALEDRAPGSGWETALGRRIAFGIGGSSWDHARALIYSGDRGRIGLLARHVAAAAEGGGVDAQRILRAAGSHLADLAETLRGRLGTLPVVFTGRAFNLHPSIAAALMEKLPGAERAASAISGAEAAARLARDSI